jgi:hypothetical protein
MTIGKEQMQYFILEQRGLLSKHRYFKFGHFKSYIGNYCNNLCSLREKNGWVWLNVSDPSKLKNPTN